jgi:pyridoxine 4-dehydrogenase
VLVLCSHQGLAWVPNFPFGGAFAGMPKMTERPDVIAVARQLGITPARAR